MIQRFTGILLDVDEAAYIARALELLAQLLAERRSQPTPRLAAVTARLTKTAENGSAATHNGSNRGSSTPSRHDSRHHLDYALISTRDAAAQLETGERNIRDLIHRGRLPARRAGGRWLVDAAAVELRAERKAARRRE